MTSFHAKVFLDEDVDLIVGDMLRSHGFEVLSTRDAGRKGKNDFDQLTFAAENGCIVLTHNRNDFLDLSVEWFESGKSHAGIIISAQHMPRMIADRVLRILDRFKAKDLINQVYIV